MQNTHHQNFKIFCDSLNENNIRYIFIRGYKYLPEKADTDLDTIIHPDDWDKYKNLCQIFIKNNIIGFEKHGIFKNYGIINNRHMIYYPIFTKGIRGEHLPNKSFRIDSYSDLYFFENDTKCKILPLSLLNYIFNNKQKINNYYIPNNISNIILLICRNIYDKKGDWNASGMKHKNIIQNIIQTIKKDEFDYVCNMFFNKSQNIYQKLLDKNYNLIKKPTKMLFLIRKCGLINHNNIIEYTRNILIDNNYCIDEEGLITIKDKKQFLNKLYYNKICDKDIEHAIINANDNMCYYFITDYLIYNKNSTTIKQILRQTFPNPENKHWNYFHSSDSSEEAYKEIDILKSNILNFLNIGTYYCQKDS